MLAGFHSSYSFQHPFRVLSAHGYTLGKFAKREDALKALHTWGQALAVIHVDRVVARKERLNTTENANSSVCRKAC
jgi:2-keto-3-deoxy-L-rhamnonate aldolase RhmA